MLNKKLKLLAITSLISFSGITVGNVTDSSGSTYLRDDWIMPTSYLSIDRSGVELRTEEMRLSDVISQDDNIESVDSEVLLLPPSAQESISTTSKKTSPIPEAPTYLMFGVGLFFLKFMMRQHIKKV